MPDRRTRLEALRDRLEIAMDDAGPQMLPQIAGQYRATLADLDEIDSQSPQAGMQDDLKAQRDARRERQKRSTPRRNANK